MTVHLPSTPRDVIAAKLKEYGVGARVVDGAGRIGTVVKKRLGSDEPFPFVIDFGPEQGVDLTYTLKGLWVVGDNSTPQDLIAVYPEGTEFFLTAKGPDHD